jgi:hypothetical protein
MVADALLRALGNADPTVQRIAAVRARRVAPTEPILGALEALFAAEDKYLRRAAAASYVALHPQGPAAPALRPLLQDPAQLVVLAARGGLLDPSHELAELAFVIRTLASASTGASLATTIMRWHRYLWLYSPNPRAETVIVDDLDRDAASLRDALVAVAAVPHDVTMLQLELGAEVGVRGFRHGNEIWSTKTAATLPALRRLADLAWDADDAPWPAMFAGGAFALAVAGALATVPPAFAGVDERELSTRLGDDQIFLGFLHAAGITFVE